MYNDDDVLYSGVVTMGDEAWEYYPVPEYTVPDSAYKAMITNVQVSYFPN
jgi:hypothetical protein